MPHHEAWRISNSGLVTRLRSQSATSSSTCSSESRARNAKPGVVLTCVGPRPRDTAVGEQGRQISIYLQLPPHKQQRSRRPALLRLAHPFSSKEGEAPRIPSNPETPASRPSRHPGIEQRG